MQHEGNIGTATATAAGATLVVTTGSEVPAGDVVLVWVAWDNNNGSTTTGPVDAQIRCDDERSNDYRMIVAGQNIGTESAQAFGTHGGIFGAVLDTTLEAGDEITLTQTATAALAAKAASVHHYSDWGAANIGVAAGVAASGSADPASETLSSLPSREYLLVHALSYEGPIGDSYTEDADYTSITAAGTNTGTPANDQSIKGGFRIATLTSDTVDVAATSRDHKTLFAACYPTDAPYVRWSHGGALSNVLTHSATTGAPTITIGGSTAWIREGDVVVFIQTSQQTTTIPRIPATGAQSRMQIAGNQRLTVGDITATIVWMRVGGSETSITGQDVSQGNLGALVIFGGCNPYGTPFEFIGEATESADTSVEFPNGSTSFDDSRILHIAAHGIDSTSAQYSAFTNGSLVFLEEIADVSSTLLNGVGIGMATGILESAGSIGSTTATLAASDVDITMTLAFKPKTAPEPATPWIRRVLAVGGSIDALALSWTAGDAEAGDVILLFVNSEAQDVSTPSDFTPTADSPQDTTGCRLEAFWKAATGSETGVTIADSGDHQIAVALAIANLNASDPFDVTAGGTEASDTSLSATGDTTTQINDLIVVAAAHSTDSNQNQHHTFATTGLTEFEHVTEYSQDVGAGGGVAVASGKRLTAGSFGPTTATLMNASTKGFISLALKEPAAPSAFTPRVILI